MKTFIVEDSPVIRENLVATLQEWTPVQVVGWADDESTARDWLANAANDCELMIVDIRLRSGTGLGVLKAAQGRPGRCVVLTNYATPDMRKRCLDLGAHRVFDKSNELDDLIGYCQGLGAGAPTTGPGSLS